MKRLLWAIVGLAMVMIAIGVVLIANSADSDLGRPWALTQSGFGTGFVVGGASFGATALALAGWWSGTARTLASVNESSPDSLIFVAQTTPAANRLAVALTNTGRAKLPTYVVCVVDISRVSIWAAHSAVPLLRVAATEISAIESGPVVLARPLPSVLMRINGQSEPLQIVPCRPNWELFAVLDNTVVAELAMRIRERLQVS